MCTFGAKRVAWEWGSGRRQCGQFYWPLSRRRSPCKGEAESLLQALGVGSGGSAGGPGAPGRLQGRRCQTLLAGRPSCGRPFVKPCSSSANICPWISLVLYASLRLLVIHALGFGVPGSGVSLSSEWVFFLNLFPNSE